MYFITIEKNNIRNLVFNVSTKQQILVKIVDIKKKKYIMMTIINEFFFIRVSKNTRLICKIYVQVHYLFKAATVFRGTT